MIQNGFNVVKNIEFKPSSIIGYYHIPLFWIDKQPSKKLIEEYSSGILPEVVYRKEMDVGIDVLARRDGFFAFDFKNWQCGAPVNETLESIINTNTRKIDKNYEPLFMRVSVVNAFIVCLYNGMAKSMKHTTDLGVLLNNSNQQSLTNIEDDPRGLFDGSHFIPYHALVKSNIGYGQDINETRNRLVVSIESIDESINLLRQILKKDDTPEALFLVNALVKSANYFREHDFSSALTLAWVVIEKVLSFLWEKYLHEKGIKEKRYKDLSDSNYTASIRSEILELGGSLNDELYIDLKKVRKVRNDWMHKMKQIHQEEARHSIVTAQKLFEFSEGFKIQIPINILTCYRA